MSNSTLVDCHLSKARNSKAPFTRHGWCPRPRLYRVHTHLKGFFSHGAGPRKLIAIVSNGAFHTVRARAPFWLVKHPRLCKKVLWDIAFNAHLHPHRVKRIPLRECALNVGADTGITRAVWKGPKESSILLRLFADLGRVKQKNEATDSVPGSIFPPVIVLQSGHISNVTTGWSVLNHTTMSLKYYFTRCFNPKDDPHLRD